MCKLSLACICMALETPKSGRDSFLTFFNDTDHTGSPTPSPAGQSVDNACKLVVDPLLGDTKRSGGPQFFILSSTRSKSYNLLMIILRGGHGIDEVHLAVPVAARGVDTKEPVLPLHCISVPLATALSFNGLHGQPPASTIYELRILN